MKENNLLKLIAILFCSFVVVNIEGVQAKSCTTKELNTLKQLAHNIKFNYELHDDTYNEAHTYYFDIFATNFSEEFYFLDMDGQDFRYMSNLEIDGTRKLRTVDEGIIYSVDVYTSNKTSCPNTKIVTKKIEVPYYNDYSQREECEEIEEFSLCQKYYDGYIESEDYFLEQINKYKKGEIEEPKEKKEFMEIVIEFISNNLLIIIPSVIVLLLVIVIITIKIIKSKKRTKIRI